MADGEEGHNPMRDVYFFITFLVIVVILWYASGGPSHASLNGIFLSAPPAAGGTGQSYGPQFPAGSGTPTTTAAQSQSAFTGGTVAAPPSVEAPASASSPVQGPPCGYVSHTSSRELVTNFSYSGNPNNDENICINACEQARNSVYGTSDSGICYFVGQNGIQYSTPINPD